MKRLYIVIILVLVCIFECSNITLAEGTSIFFVNGMFNNSINANNSYGVLKSKIKSELPDNADVKFGLLYNCNESFEFQLREVISQKTSDVWTYYLMTIAGLGPDWLRDARNQIEAVANVTNYVIDLDLQNHVKRYNEELAKGRRVIAVSHSQGNFYANEAHSLVNSDRFFVVGVANPASHVAGGGDYVTVTNDETINMVRTLAGSTLEGNCVNENTSDVLGHHSFVNEYLAGDVSGPQIVNSVIALIVKDTVSDSEIFFEDFENLSDDQVWGNIVEQDGNHVLRLSRAKNNCVGQSSEAPELQFSDHIEFSFRVNLNPQMDEYSQYCSYEALGVGLDIVDIVTHHVNLMTFSAPNVVQFANGYTVSSAYTAGQWFDVKIKLQKIDDQAFTDYWINGEHYGSFSGESNLNIAKYNTVRFRTMNGTTYLDDIAFKNVQ